MPSKLKNTNNTTIRPESFTAEDKEIVTGLHALNLAESIARITKATDENARLLATHELRAKLIFLVRNLNNLSEQLRKDLTISLGPDIVSLGNYLVHNIDAIDTYSAGMINFANYLNGAILELETCINENKNIVISGQSAGKINKVNSSTETERKDLLLKSLKDLQSFLSINYNHSNKTLTSYNAKLAFLSHIILYVELNTIYDKNGLVSKRMTNNTLYWNANRLRNQFSHCNHADLATFIAENSAELDLLATQFKTYISRLDLTPTNQEETTQETEPEKEIEKVEEIKQPTARTGTSKKSLKKQPQQLKQTDLTININEFFKFMLAIQDGTTDPNSPESKKQIKLFARQTANSKIKTTSLKIQAPEFGTKEFTVTLPLFIIICYFHKDICDTNIKVTNTEPFITSEQVNEVFLEYLEQLTLLTQSSIFGLLGLANTSHLRLLFGAVTMSEGQAYYDKLQKEFLRFLQILVGKRNFSINSTSGILSIADLGFDNLDFKEATLLFEQLFTHFKINETKTTISELYRLYPELCDDKEKIQPITKVIPGCAKDPIQKLVLLFSLLPKNHKAEHIQSLIQMNIDSLPKLTKQIALGEGFDFGIKNTPMITSEFLTIYFQSIEKFPQEVKSINLISNLLSLNKMDLNADKAAKLLITTLSSIKGFRETILDPNKKSLTPLVNELKRNPQNINLFIFLIENIFTNSFDFDEKLWEYAIETLKNITIPECQDEIKKALKKINYQKDYYDKMNKKVFNFNDSDNYIIEGYPSHKITDLHYAYRDKDWNKVYLSVKHGSYQEISSKTKEYHQLPKNDPILKAMIAATSYINQTIEEKEEEKAASQTNDAIFFQLKSLEFVLELVTDSKVRIELAVAIDELAEELGVTPSAKALEVIASNEKTLQISTPQNLPSL